MISVVVLGAGGRMGRALIACLASGRAPELRLAGAVDLWDSPVRGQDAGRMAGVGELGIVVGTNLEQAASGAGVVIDFSGHHGTAGNAPRCAGWGVPMVIGTTGLTKDEQLTIEEASRQIPIVMAPNMSLGVNLLQALIEDAARALKGKGYDVEIVERHHRMKKDAPSGTALALGQAVAKGFEWRLDQVAAHGRSGVSSDVRPEQQIGFHAVRGGDFVGDHTVVFAGTGECIEFSHRATSRDTFAMGALRAAEWVVGREPGLYRMRDVLGL
ncbi:MAG: 4-hydroxy-tetrahydrodipicolinate reductase [Kiritimatiellae bacterium]|nr:4-hydroxy-tetrahydrodipicolinate reductase [Kiritimatiellia bacterium]